LYSSTMKSLLVLLVVVASVNAWAGYTCKFETVHTNTNISPPLKFSAAGMPATYVANSAQFDVIAFNLFNATYGTGDTEGSVLCKKFIVGNGFTVGWGATFAAEGSYPLVVDGPAFFGSGDVLPAGNDIYISGTFTAPSYLTSRRLPTGGSNLPQPSGYGWAPLWSQAAYYNSLPSDLSAQPQTVNWHVQYGTLHITGFSGSLNEGTYFINIPVATFNSINAYSYDAVIPTNGGALTINVVGTSGYTATFGGGQLPAGVFTYINYNFNNAGTVIVNTGVYGSILAPTATVHQIGGVIWGKVVGLNVHALQINKAICHK